MGKYILEDRTSAKYQKAVTVKIPDEIKRFYDELNSNRKETARPLRAAIIEAITELYNQYKKAV